jgi:hypothetical protein
MLTTVIENLNPRFQSLENCLELYANWETAVPPHLAAAPGLQDRSFRHCSIITALYALWEGFVEDALAVWLIRLPRYFTFAALSDPLKNRYRCAVANLVHGITRREFRHLTIETIIETYHDSLKGNPNWSFVADALTMHDANIRKEQIAQLFSSLEIPDIWRSIETDPEVVAQRDVIDGSVNAENLLNEFVNHRNDASHGAPEDLLGPDLLRQWISFIRAMCNAINRALTLRALQGERHHFPDCAYGKVVHKHKGNIAIVELYQGKRLKLGDSFYFLRQNSYRIALVQSLQVDGVNHNEISAIDNIIEVGIALSTEIQNDCELVSVSFA